MANATGHYIAPVTAYDDYGRPLFVAEHDDDIQYLSDSTGSRSSSISRLSLRGFLASDEVAVNGVGADGVASDGVGQIKKKDHSKEAHHHHQQGNLRRYLSFGCAILSCLCAGSITAFSLYGHLFLSKLHYTQYEVNSVSIAAELAMYLPVPFVGYLCDRYNPGAISGLSSILFGLGYSLAAFTYLAGPPIEAGGTGWPVAMMILAFIGIGSGTSSMYISAVTTCAKNFGSGRLRGLALAVPIAAFGLSGMWQSQVGSRYFGIQDPDTGRDTLDVFKFFLFLSVLLFVVGIIGIFGLQVIDEEILIDEAVEELERSGLLEDSAFFRNGSTQQQSYGTIAQGDSMDDEDDDDEVTPTLTRTQSYVDGQRKKTWLLNAETRIFLADHTMWWFAGGFFLVTGPGEAFINNLGTIIGTLTPPSAEESYAPTTAATHVSIVAISSTLARILTGLLSDMLAPVTISRPFNHPHPPTTTPTNHHNHHHNHHHQPSARSSLSSHLQHEASLKRRLHISRVTLLIFSALLMSAGQVLLASGAIQQHAERFWMVSALIGTGYGAVFSLTPIICSVVWGVENFGTNWGIVAIVPAFGATAWGLVYSAVYQAGADHPLHHHLPPSLFSFLSSFSSSSSSFPGDDKAKLRQTPDGSISSSLCFGKECYVLTFWAMAVSVWIACGMWLWAWRGWKGWKTRGIAV